MPKKNTQTLLVAASLIALAGLLSSDPNCDRGCRTVAQHLLEHGIEDFLKGLFA